MFEELKARGLIAQTSNEEKLKELIDSGNITFYIGFDPTADSLHVGHFLQMVTMKHLQSAGNRPIALLGGGTTMVGDPSGRTDMRQMLTKEQIGANAEKFRKQFECFIDFSGGRALIINNADWLLNLNYVDFLRDIGVHFSVNRMLTAECFKSRMEHGLSFIEFNYMLMQSYDFLVLFREYGCVLQCGGDDQWSNILAGADLIRRKTGKEAYALTFSLLLTSEGKKMGKTQRGAVWLDPSKTPPYDFYQYWRNVDDADVINCMKLLTFIPLPEINEMAKLQGSELNAVKERLAFELCEMIHGREEAERAQNAARALFTGGGDMENVPSTTLSDGDFENGKISALELLIKCGLAPSKGEAKRLISQGGVTAGGESVSDPFYAFDKSAFLGDGLLLKKGKKTYHLAKM